MAISLKKLKTAFPSIELTKLKILRSLLLKYEANGWKNNNGAHYYVELMDKELPDTCSILAQAYNPHRSEYVLLLAANELLDTCGVEYIEHINDGDGISYCNTGDSYELTLLFNHLENKFTIGCWADYVEQSPEEYV